jgi:hypothetical protein
MGLIEKFSHISHNKIFEHDEKYARLVELYNSWGDSISSPEDYQLFSSVVKHDLEVDEARVGELMRKAIVVGDVDGIVGKFITESIVNEQDPAIKPEPQKQESQPGACVEPKGASAQTDNAEGATSEGLPSEEDGKATEEQIQADQLPEKEYLGSTQDKHYYIVRSSNDSGDISDVVVEDQTEEEVWSAKEKGVNFTDMKELIKAVVSDLDLELVSTDIIIDYKMLEEENPEEDMEEVPQGTPPAEANPGEVGGERMESSFDGAKNESLTEGIKDTLKKAGVDVESGHWHRNGDNIYFYGVHDDIAQAVADQLCGHLEGNVIEDGIKTYKVVLESRITEATQKEMGQSLINYIKDHGALNNNLGQISNEIKADKLQGTYKKEQALDKVLAIVKEGAGLAYKVEGQLVPTSEAFPSESMLKETAVELLNSISERVNEDYEILAADIADMETAKQLAQSKQGYAIADPDPNKKDKFLVVRNKQAV